MILGAAHNHSPSKEIVEGKPLVDWGTVIEGSDQTGGFLREDVQFSGSQVLS